MSVSLTKENKNTVSLSFESKQTRDITWDEATYSWDQAVHTWVMQTAIVVEEAKNNSSLSLETKL